MKKAYLMKSMAAMAIGVVVASCSKDVFSGSTVSEEDAAKNAENKLGITINPNQTWRMTQEVKAEVAVNLGLDQSYTVAIYDKNPLTNTDLTYYAKETVAEGATFSKSITVPSASKELYVAAFDSKLRRVVNLATIENGAINVNFGVSASRSNRAIEADYTDTYAKSSADYLNGLTVAAMSQYEAFNDDLIDANGHILVDGATIPGSTQTVSGSQTFYAYDNFNPTNGQSIQIKDGDVLLGTLTFEGTGSATETVNQFYMGWQNFTKVVKRDAVKFTPAINGKLSIAYQGKYAPLTWTDNGTPISTQYNTYDGKGDWNDTHSYKNDLAVVDNAQAGHTYRICYSDGIAFAALKFEYSSTITTEATTRPGDGYHFRVPQGTTITKPIFVQGIDAQGNTHLNGAVIYVEGTLNVSGGANNNFNSTTIVVGNHGNLVLKGAVNMPTYGRFIVLPGGSITAPENTTPSLTVNNGGACYNGGTINFNGEFNVNGSDFYNNGTINVNLIRNTSGGKITNFGHITAVTNALAADAYNCEFINGCYWHYTGDAGIGQLTMLKNSRLEVDGKAEFRQNHLSQDDPITNATPNILMENSVVKVGTAYCTNTIFQGPSENGKVAIVVIEDGLMVGRALDITQWDNCYFDWDSEEIYNKDGVKQTLAMEDGEHGIYSGVHKRITNLIKDANSMFTIPSDDECSGDGYNPDGHTDNNIGSKPIYSYAFEDSKNCDYDMNDVVLRVQEVEVDGKAKLNLTLVASGATLNLNIRLYPAAEPQSGEVAHYDGDYQVLSYNNQTEVHAMLGVPEGTMVNTGAGATARFVTIQIDKGSYNPAALPIAIYAPATDVEMRLARTGEPPFGVIVPEQWKWPKEYVRVSWAYNATETDSEGDQSFATFASSTNSANNWYNYPTGSVMDDKDLTFE